MFWLFICVFLVFVTATSYLAEHRGCSKWEASASILGYGFLLVVGLVGLGIMLFYLATLPKVIQPESISAKTSEQLTPVPGSEQLTPSPVPGSPVPESDLSEADKEHLKEQLRIWAKTPAPGNPTITVMDQMLSDPKLSETDQAKLRILAKTPAPAVQGGELDGILADLKAGGKATPAQPDPDSIMGGINAALSATPKQ
ncbi:MAG: hypothetical protein V4446_08390 [Pseudomonadota bacterium]